MKQQLISLFRTDHVIMSNGFHLLGELIKTGNLNDARVCAAKISHDAGPHIAFEEEDFYPALNAILDPLEIDQMHATHEMGRQVIADIMALNAGSQLGEKQRLDLLEKIQAVEAHISGFKVLVEAVNKLDDQQIEHLLKQLKLKGLSASDWLESQDVNQKISDPGNRAE